MKAILLLPLLLASCTISNANWNVALGGKGAYNGAGFSVTWDNEKSFNDAAWVGMAAIPAVQAVKVAQSADKLSAIKDTNAAGVAKQTIKSNQAIELGKQGVEKTKIIHHPLQ